VLGWNRQLFLFINASADPSGAGVAWSRIYLGVHFPLDMIASMLVAVVSGDIARLGQPVVTDWICPWWMARMSFRCEPCACLRC
jgi:hypothetical protein